MDKLFGQAELRFIQRASSQEMQAYVARYTFSPQGEALFTKCRPQEDIAAYLKRWRYIKSRNLVYTPR